MNPWSSFLPATCLPDQCNCELTRDALIRQPSAFWSSFAYLCTALLIYREIGNKTSELKMWAGVCFLMGLSSLFGHASFINLALAFDFASIILVLSFFALLNLMGNYRQKTFRIFLTLLLYYISVFAVMYYMDKWPKIFLSLLVFAFSLFDLIRTCGIDFFKHRALQISFAVLAISFGMFMVDEFHWGCEPESWFQWHSMWHVGTAISMYYYGKWRFTCA